MANDLTVFSVNDIRVIGEAIAKSKLFGVTNAEQAVALCLIAHAEGLHPAIAARDYHIVNGHPTLKADAMLARFQSAGGKVEWHEYTDDKCDATFTHPQGGTVRVDWDMPRVKKAEISNAAMYKKYPRNMLRARVISEGIRTIFPGVLVGTYTPEEAEDFEKPKSAMAQWAETPPPVIEHEESPLEKAAKELERRLNACTSLHILTSVVAHNNNLLLELKNKMPEKYEYLSQEIAKHQEAFNLAEAAE